MWGEPCPDCGEMLPIAKDWSEGRPCSRTALDRGRGWDGRALPKHTDKVIARWSTQKPAPTPAPKAMPRWIRRTIDAMIQNGGNRLEVARQLDISRSSVSAVLTVARTRDDLTEAERAAIAPLRHRARGLAVGHHRRLAS